MSYDIDKMIKNMKDAGCDDSCINEFLVRYDSGNLNQCDKVLSEHRKSLLDQLHEEQRKIDCLDYLSYQLKKL